MSVLNFMEIQRTVQSLIAGQRRGRSAGYTVSVKLPKQSLKQEMGLRNRTDALCSAAHYYALWPRCVTHVHPYTWITTVCGSAWSNDRPSGLFYWTLHTKNNQLQSTRIFYTEILTTGNIACVTCELLKWEWLQCHFRSSGTIAQNPQKLHYSKSKTAVHSGMKGCQQQYTKCSRENLWSVVVFHVLVT